MLDVVGGWGGVIGGVDSEADVVVVDFVVIFQYRPKSLIVVVVEVSDCGGGD